MMEQFFESMADAIMQRIEKKLALRKRVYSLEEAAEYLGLTPKALQQKRHAEKSPRSASTGCSGSTFWISTAASPTQRDVPAMPPEACR